VLDHDAEQIEALRKFGFRVYYGDATRLDLLEAAGAKDAKVFVLAIDDRDRALVIATSVLRHFPHLHVIARAYDRVHAYQLLNLGVHSVHREVFGTSVDVAREVLTTLGRHPFEAHRAAALFKAHDERIVRASASHQLDQTKLIDISRTARAEIANARSGRWRQEPRPGRGLGSARARRRLSGRGVAPGLTRGRRSIIVVSEKTEISGNEPNTRYDAFHPALGRNGHPVGGQSHRRADPCAALSRARAGAGRRDRRDAKRSAFERQHELEGAAGLGPRQHRARHERPPRPFHDARGSLGHARDDHGAA
jgi:voltage-gated potassium channel Kch